MKDDHILRTIRAYDSSVRGYASKAARYAPVRERDAFMKSVVPGGRILDAGCGPGRDSRVFAQAGFRVTGIDLSANLLTFARTDANDIRFLVMDLRNLTFGPSSFEGIWACASLLHLKRDEIRGVVQSFRRILVPGGIVYILMKEGAGEEYATSSTIPDSERFFTYVRMDELNDIVTSAGFHVIRSDRWDQRDRNPERPSEIWTGVLCRG